MQRIKQLIAASTRNLVRGSVLICLCPDYTAAEAKKCRSLQLDLRPECSPESSLLWRQLKHTRAFNRVEPALRNLLTVTSWASSLHERVRSGLTAHAQRPGPRDAWIATRARRAGFAVAKFRRRVFVSHNQSPVTDMPATVANATPTHCSSSTTAAENHR